VNNRQFKLHLLARIEILLRGDHAECEGAEELQSIVDWIDAVGDGHTHHATLQDMCDWVGEPNLVQVSDNKA